MDAFSKNSNSVAMTGYRLARNGRTASQRAALAASIITGEIDFIQPTKKQIATLLGVSVVYVNQALVLNRFQLALVREGYVTLAQFQKPTDGHLHHVIEQAGVDRAWAVIEEII
jgi:hypothetical protein